MKPKMIVVDLDGTLLNKERKIEIDSINYLKKLKEKGYIITIATGRILNAVLDATNGAEFANYIVGDAGAAVYKSNKWETVYNNIIAKKTAIIILSYFDENKFSHINICNKEYIYKLTKLNLEENKIVKNTTNKEEIIEKCEEITHISIGFLNNELVKEYYNIFSSEFPELQINIMQDSFDDVKWLEITMKGVSKYNGIDKIANLENIPNKNIIAFGDGLNDIDMLKRCGIGVAMQNALQEVKDVSDYVTKKPHYENGVIEFLKEYLDDEKFDE